MHDEGIDDPLRVTAVVVLAVLLFGYFLAVDWLVYFGLGLLGLALLSSTVNEYFAWIWMKFARMIGTVNSKVILTIIFYLFLTPISLLYRAVMGNPLISIRNEGENDSYLVSRNKTFTRDDFKTPW